MNVEGLLSVVGIVILVLFVVNETRFLIWSGFGLPLKGTSPNCGPEQRYKFDTTIKDRDGLINLLKQKETSGELGWQSKLDNFRDSPQGEINWNKVKSSVIVSSNGALIFYQKTFLLKFNPYGCFEYNLKVTSSGEVSLYGCCGE